MESNHKSGTLIVPGIILLCVFDGETLVRKFGAGDSLEMLLTSICTQWNLHRENISLYYTIPDHPKCVLDTQSDFEIMMELAASFGLKQVRVEVCLKDGNLYRDDGQSPLPTLQFDEKCDSGPSYCSSEKRSLKKLGWEREVTEVGQKFEGGAKEFRMALRKSSIDSGHEFKYVKNDSTRVTVECVHKESLGCLWNVHASRELINGFFYVRKINNIHTCGSSGRDLKHKRMNASLVSSLIIDQVRNNPNIRPIEVVRHFATVYDMEISYDVAWSGVEKAKNCCLGDQNESFDDLRWYVGAALDTNPGSRIELDVDETSRRFRRIFASFKACIDGFSSCRPLLFLEETHLNGRFKGKLLAATGKDGNQGLFPLAYAIVDSENEHNWRWFLRILKDILSSDRIISFVSDRNPGLLEAMAEVFPHSPHAYCLNHLKTNLEDKYSAKLYSKELRNRLVSLLTTCAYAPTVELFQVNMSTMLNEGGIEAQKFFENFDVYNWANAYFRGNRYGEMCSDATETFNSWIINAMHFPITKLVDSIRIELMALLCERRELGKTWDSDLCPAVDEKLAPLMDEGKRWPVVGSVETTFEVQCVPPVKVDIVERTCSCMQWQVTGLPCSHAVACILKVNRPISTYVDCYFHKASYLKTYENPIFHIPTFGKPQCNAKENAILPPITNCSPGRPKKKRIRSGGEHIPRFMKCGRCGRLGNHNRKTCNEPIS